MCKWFHTNENQKTQDLLLSQLHEQYASNNNANLSSFVTLLVSMVGVFGIFAYVFVRSSLKFSNDFQSLYDSGSELYTMDVLILSAMVSIIVLGIIKYICLYQGFHQRYEQFITYAIREKYFGKENCEKSDIFPEGYTPFGKQGLDIAQGLFGEFAKISDLLLCIILFAVELKIFCYVNLINGHLLKMLLPIILVLFMASFSIIIKYHIPYDSLESIGIFSFLRDLVGLRLLNSLKLLIKTTICICIPLSPVLFYNNSCHLEKAIIEIVLLSVISFLSILVNAMKFKVFRSRYENLCLHYRVKRIIGNLLK